jgi:hypothetical protein
MPNVLVRDLPADVHAALLGKAAARQQSLQQFLAIELRRIAEEKQLADILDDIERRHSGGRIGFQQAVDAVEAERDQR